MSKRLGIIMHGVTGRMGLNQHLIRSVLAIRNDGGFRLTDGSRVMLDPIIVGRNESKIRALAEAHGISRWTTDLNAALGNSDDALFFDAGTTEMRADLLERAMRAGKHVYSEKPVALTQAEALRLVSVARETGVKNGVVRDKLYLPGLIKLKRLRDAGFFGRLLSVRGEFGYWVFEGDWGQPAQRPSWNYRKADGGGIITDMLCHWRYVLDETFAPVRAVQCLGANHIRERVDESGKRYASDADDAAYATFQLEGGVIAQINSSWCTRVRRDDLVTFHVDGTLGSAVAGLTQCWSQSRVNTPRPVWNPDVPNPFDFRSQWQEVPDNAVFANGFRAQWEEFLRHVLEGAACHFGIVEGAKGVQLAELGLKSWHERCWLDVPNIAV